MRKMLLPEFAIVGAQKSASTFLQDALSGHPDIYMPAGETRHFEDPEYQSAGIDDLAALFAGRTNQLRGIKRPDYLARPEVPTRIREAVPGMKILAVLRDPIDRLVSAYYYYIKLGFMPVLDINEAIPRILRGETIGSPKSRELLEYGMYATHLERYLACFPRAQLLVLMQEDIASTPREALRTTCGFLGVDPDRTAVPGRQSNAGVYPLSRLRFLTQRNRFLYDYDPVTGKVIPRRRTPVRIISTAAISAIDRFILARWIGNDKPALHADVRSMLLRHYREQVVATERIVGRDLGAWK